MKKILAINGHPNKNSFNSALLENYVRGAQESGAEVRTIHVTDMALENYLRCCGRGPIGDDIKNAQADISWADHLVFFHPVWWASFPALFKIFVDMIFTPGFAYKFTPKNPFQKKLLKGKTAHIILTLNTPLLVYRFVFGSPSVRQLKDRVLGFCGIKTSCVTYVGPIIDSTEDQRKKFLNKVYLLGKKLA
ncbi:MAG: NAD(P)H-dependent oxidoreductase [Candidatus Pacebacteria bacterium]|jgi:putative NADPH-quinone reductase|nr:NAD(P)H-dependent oxidoreductase [Candidatus Paceibacterota bacterium]